MHVYPPVYGPPPLINGRKMKVGDVRNTDQQRNGWWPGGGLWAHAPLFL